LHIPHATPYVVGDLSKKEAEEYFEKHVLPRYECKELEGKFDYVRKITGTQYNMLLRGLYPKGLRYPDKPNPPLWEDYDLIKTMEAIVKTENREYILEKDLIKEIGFKQVNSLVDYNFLHCRPTKRYANDIDSPDGIILTAMNQPSVRAMERHLSE
ncbi:3164_t:CDS:2, partial [Dentiscutata erythropus]